MIAAFSTLAFLATLWLLVVLGAAVLENSGGKIAAAFKGRSVNCAGVFVAPLRMKARPELRQPIRASARLSAAA